MSDVREGARLTPGAPAWQGRLAGRLLAGYRDPGLVYDQLLREAFRGARVWIDAGCGDNFDILNEQGFAGLGLGIDRDDRKQEKYLRADLYRLPFRGASADLVSSRWVFEHLEAPEAALAELGRVLRPGGTLLIRTTNRWHYTSRLGRWLPLGFKSALSGKRVYPTLFRFNDPGTVRRFLGQYRGWRLERLELIENLHHGNPLLFIFSVLGLKLADWCGLENFRSTIILRLVKAGPETADPGGKG